VSRAYRIYQHPTRGSWAYALAAEGPAETATLSPDRTASLAPVGRVALGARIQEKVRQGFVLQAQTKYLATHVEAGVLKGEFTSNHPDLVTAHLSGEQVFFVALRLGTDMPEVAQQLREQLDGTPGGSQERAQWLTHVGRVTTYLPVMSRRPEEALAVAHWATNQGLLLMPCTDRKIPEGSPEKHRFSWRDYLAAWWQVQSINEAFASMGWPLHEALVAAPQSAASSTTDAAADWLTAVQQYSF